MAEGALYQVKKYVEMARETDYIMPTWLPFLPLILIIIGVLLAIPAILSESETAVYASLGIIIGILVIGVFINFYVIYKWIKRRNEHFRRTQGLWSGVLNFFEYHGINDPEVVAIREAVNESRFDEDEKSAAGWTIATIVPFVIYYVYHFLNKDFVKHERREMRIMQNLKSIFSKRGVYFEAPMYPSVKDRSTFLYFILSLITAGIFQLYWVYTLTKDPNEHFRMHMSVEQKLLASLEELSRKMAEGEAA